MNRIALLIAGAAAGLPLLISSTPALGDPPAAKPTLQGAWDVEVILREDAQNCATSPAVGVGPNPFPTFNMFHQGGTMTEWGTRSPPSTRGGGHGIWKQTGADTYRYRLLFHSFDANGLLTATMDINSNLRLGAKGYRFSGVSRFVMTDLSGNARRFCATLSGKRITF